MKSNFILIFICFCLITPRYGFAQAKLPLCTTLADIKAHDGQRVQVFGELARHYKLPHRPLILLLKNEGWIFMGNDTLYHDQDLSGDFALVEGVVYASNPRFELANLHNKPIDSFISMFASLPPPAKTPQKIIRAHPFFDQVPIVQRFPVCRTKAELSKNLNRWVVLYGWLSVRNRRALAFRSTRRKPLFKFDMPLKNKQLTGHRMGMVIVKFDKADTPPTAVFRQQVFPRCQTKAQIKKYRGKIVALSGKLKNNVYRLGIFRPYLYVYSLPGHLVYQRHRRKLKLITRIYHYHQPFFYDLDYFFNRRYFGQAGYLRNALWHDK